MPVAHRKAVSKAPGQARRPNPPPASRALHAAVFDLVGRGLRDGVLRSDLPAALFSPAVTGTLNRAVGFAAALGLGRERVGDRVADLVLSGFGPSDRSSGRT